MKNKLIIIGYLGNKKAYLNLTKEEAIKRYVESEKISADDKVDITEDMIEQFDFETEFFVYDAWNFSS